MALAGTIVVLGIVGLIGLAVWMIGGSGIGEGSVRNGRDTTPAAAPASPTPSSTNPSSTNQSSPTRPPAAPGATRVDAGQSAPQVFRETLDEAFIDFAPATAYDGPSSCTVTGLQGEGSADYAVDATITNVDDDISAYRMEYELFGPDGTSLGTDYGVIGRIEPGRTVVDDTVGIIGSDVDWASVDCEVLAVLRVDAF